MQPGEGEKRGTASHDAEPHPETYEIRKSNFMVVHHDGVRRRPETMKISSVFVRVHQWLKNLFS